MSAASRPSLCTRTARETVAPRRLNPTSPIIITTGMSSGFTTQLVTTPIGPSTAATEGRVGALGQVRHHSTGDTPSHHRYKACTPHSFLETNCISRLY